MDRFYVKLVIAALSLLTGIVLALWRIIVEGNYYTAASLFICGILFGWVLLLGRSSTDSSIFVILTALAPGLGIAAFMTETDGTNLKRQFLQNDVMTQFAELSVQLPHGMLFTPQEKQLINEGFKVCALQNNLEMLEAVQDAHKGEYMGPGLTLADEAYKRIQGHKPRTTCLQYYGQLKKTKPELFADIDKKHSEYLSSIKEIQ